MWRDKVSINLRVYLDKELRGTYSELKAIRNAKDKSTAQLWVAIANISSRLDAIERKLGKPKNKELLESLDEM